MTEFSDERDGLNSSTIPPRHASEMEFIRHALDSAAIVAMTDVSGTITFVNSKFCEISGYSEEELLGANHRMLQSGLHDKMFFRDMYRQIARGNVWHGELCNRRKDGSHYWVDTTIVPHFNIAGKVDSYTAIRFDVTARHQAEELLRQAVSKDSLTGIANRREFHIELEAALVEGRSQSGRVSLILLDLDTFKEVNDAFGHYVGDELLKDVARKLGVLAETGCIVARLGGDEFGIIIPARSSQNIDEVTEAIMSSMRQPVRLAGALRRYSASIGVATFPDDAQTQDALFKAADLALYSAKALGRDRSKHFTVDMQIASERRAELIEAIEAGLATNQFCLFYQPIVPVRGGHPYDVEALLRWEHPQHGIISPGVFLTNVEDPGILAAIGQFVVERVMTDVRAFRDRGLDLGQVAINVSNADFRSDDFVDTFLRKCQENGIPPNSFCIEVTEGVFLGRDFEHVSRRIAKLHDAGVEIALDDFGTGFASLTHLRQMPIDCIKIDRSFVANLPENGEDKAIVRGIVDIAHSLGKSITAEGVETEAQARMLASFGCEYLQGWHFSKARRPEELDGVLRELCGSSRVIRYSTGNLKTAAVD